jgi:hypothetical protein
MSTHAVKALEVGPANRRGPGIGADLRMEPVAAPPAQFFSGMRLDASVVPEKRLMFAILQEAFVDYSRHAGARTHDGQREFERVARWFASDDATWQFSFANICGWLDLDPAYVRRGLAQWHARRAAEGGGPSRSYLAPVRRLAGARTRVRGRPIGIPRDE